MEGGLARSPGSGGGVGYGPICVPVQEGGPAGRGRTPGQMAPEEKHAIADRGQAFRDLAPILAEILSR